MSGITIEHRVDRADLALGCVWARGISVTTPAALAEALTRVVEERRADLAEELDDRRKACRDILNAFGPETLPTAQAQALVEIKACLDRYCFREALDILAGMDRDRENA